MTANELITCLREVAETGRENVQVANVDEDLEILSIYVTGDTLWIDVGTERQSHEWSERIARNLK